MQETGTTAETETRNYSQTKERAEFYYFEIYGRKRHYTLIISPDFSYLRNGDDKEAVLMRSTNKQLKMKLYWVLNKNPEFADVFYEKNLGRKNLCEKDLAGMPETVFLANDLETIVEQNIG